MIRAIIIDDEFLARQRIIKLLESHPEIKVIGEAKNGNQAVEIINHKEPELLFLDVQMPDFDGFEVIKRMKPKKLPYVVFTTAYDSYAIRAFDIHALDYLLKPIDEDRFNHSVNKLLKHFEIEKSSAFSKKLIKMLKGFEQPQSDHLKTITITERGWEHVIDLDDVLYIEASGNYANLTTDSKSFMHRSTMNALSDKLNPEEFLRIHRSIIVNRRFIKKCIYVNNNEYKFTMKDGKVLLSGRTYRDNILQYLS